MKLKKKKTFSLALAALFILLWGVGGLFCEEKGQFKLPPIRLSAKTWDLLEKKQWAEAAEALVAIYDGNNDYRNLKYYLAYCYGQLGSEALEAKQYNDAITYFDNGVFYLDEDPGLYFALGVAHLRLSNYSEAEDAFNEVLGLQPNHFRALKALGDLFYITDEPDKTVYYWEEALKIKGTDKALRKRLDKLKKQRQMAGEMETRGDNMFTITFDGQRDETLYDTVSAALDKAYSQLGQELNLYPKRRIKVFLFTKKAFFDITGSPTWAGGIYEGQIKLPVENYNREILEVVLRHEYVHAVIYDALANRCPWWLNEGLAQYYSGDDRVNRLKLNFIHQRMAQGKTPQLETLPGDIAKDAEKAKTAYALALSAVDYLVTEYNAVRVQSLIEALRAGTPFEKAFEEATSYTFKEFKENWRQARQ